MNPQTAATKRYRAKLYQVRTYIEPSYGEQFAKIVAERGNQAEAIRFLLDFHHKNKAG